LKNNEIKNDNENNDNDNSNGKIKSDNENNENDNSNGIIKNDNKNNDNNNSNDNDAENMSTISGQDKNNHNVNIIESISVKTDINNEDNNILLENNEPTTELNDSKELSSEPIKEQDATISINSYSDIDLLIHKYTEKFDARKKIHEVRSVENRQSFFESGRQVVEDSNIRIRNYQKGHDRINEDIPRGPNKRRMSTIKLKTFYDRNENIINITEDKYIKSKAEEIFGESLRSSNSDNYEYEFFPKGSNIYLNTKNNLPVIEDEIEDENESTFSDSITEDNNKSLTEDDKLIKEDIYDENTQDLNKLIINEYYDEYKLEKDKLFDENKNLEDNEFLNKPDLIDNGKLLKFYFKINSISFYSKIIKFI